MPKVSVKMKKNKDNGKFEVRCGDICTPWSSQTKEGREAEAVSTASPRYGSEGVEMNQT